jgi:hypothetical protein
MRRVFSYHQNVAKFIPDPNVREGICLAMSYYVMKRMLAGLTTTPELLARKMGAFTSMQRAHDIEVRETLKGGEWVEMLAKRDNLRVNRLQQHSDFDDLISEFLQRAEDVQVGTSYENIALYYCVYGNGWGHAIALCMCLRRPRMQMFDPNGGMFEAAAGADMDKVTAAMKNAYPGGDMYTGLAVIGTPRDLKALAID